MQLSFSDENFDGHDWHLEAIFLQHVVTKMPLNFVGRPIFSMQAVQSLYLLSILSNKVGAFAIYVTMKQNSA